MKKNDVILLVAVAAYSFLFFEQIAGINFLLFNILMIGLLWDIVFPINKNMWTSSFVLFAGGWSLLLLSLFYFIIEVVGLKKWALPFIWIGTNSILIYMAAHGVINFEYTANYLFGGLINFTPLLWQPAWLGCGILIIQLALVGFLYKKKWFLKV